MSKKSKTAKSDEGGSEKRCILFRRAGHEFRRGDFLMARAEEGEAPYVATIIDRSKSALDEYGLVKVRWIYKQSDLSPETLASKPLLPDDVELFYSFHEDCCPIQSVFGRAVVFATTTAPVIPKGGFGEYEFVIRFLYDINRMKLFPIGLHPTGHKVSSPYAMALSELLSENPYPHILPNGDVKKMVTVANEDVPNSPEVTAGREVTASKKRRISEKDEGSQRGAEAKEHGKCEAFRVEVAALVSEHGGGERVSPEVQKPTPVNEPGTVREPAKIDAGPARAQEPVQVEVAELGAHAKSSSQVKVPERAVELSRLWVPEISEEIPATTKESVVQCTIPPWMQHGHQSLFNPSKNVPIYRQEISNNLIQKPLYSRPVVRWGWGSLGSQDVREVVLDVLHSHLRGCDMIVDAFCGENMLGQMLHKRYHLPWKAFGDPPPVTRRNSQNYTMKPWQTVLPHQLRGNLVIGLALQNITQQILDHTLSFTPRLVFFFTSSFPTLPSIYQCLHMEFRFGPSWGGELGARFCVYANRGKLPFDVPGLPPIERIDLPRSRGSDIQSVWDGEIPFEDDDDDEDDGDDDDNNDGDS